MTRREATPVAAAMALLVALGGCGGPGRPATYPAGGVVSYGGRPLEGAAVTFMPKNGRIATGQTDAQGAFELTTFEANDGAIAGEHVVLVSKREKMVDPDMPSSPYEMTRESLPPRYSNPAESGLTATVESGGENRFEFELHD